ncbi:hypothetical protein V494_05261 [Pseudogymnoascus sp. VKM F-4513 (FW-928)]|nr:hypothetical protein V494_05261 [Pseudogymnoascus sp. VKM F-4513 (FW-928)]
MPPTRPVSTKRFDVPAPPPNSPNERDFDALWRWSALDNAVDSIWIDELQVENWKQETDSHAASDTTDTSILTVHQTQSENSKPRTSRLSPSNTTNTSILTPHQNRSDSSTPDRLPSRTAYGSVCNEDLELDPGEAAVQDLAQVPKSVAAVLIRVDGGNGALRVFSHPLINVLTGPDHGGGHIIVNVSGEDTRIFGSPSLRYFRRRRS